MIYCFKLWKQSTTHLPVHCSMLPPQANFIRKATVCLHSFISICADSETVGMVIDMNETQLRELILKAISEAVGDTAGAQSAQK